MASEKTAWQHRITMTERESLSVEGVHSLGSYDEKEIRMETEDGMLSVQGEGMNIKQLNLEAGSVVIEGFVRALIYDEKESPRKSLLDRLLK
ncbi:MAG: YabP/YqfC family sporulation protein [Selenomonadales bacterium]|nr:YabP/YqfC family sporulation protein [Selenomonadales bacterium]